MTNGRRDPTITPVLSRIAILTATWLPAWALAAIYGNWLLACVELGRAPTPSLDDPKHVGTVTPLVHWFSAWSLVIGFYAFWLAALVLLAMLVLRPLERTRLALRLAGALAGCALLYVVLRLDPGHVFDWYMD